jgi:3-dehydroquinate synthase
MEKLEVNIETVEDRAYPIWIGSGLLDQVAELVNLDKYSSIVVICDEKVRPHWAEKLEKGIGRAAAIIDFQTGEDRKNITTVEAIWHRFMELKLDRKSLVINFGGGVIGDMGGFAASTFMRGVDFVQIPTTLLSQVDASVGGKVGINFGETKNIIGSFSQPVAVIIDVDTLQTLPGREYRSGFAEIIKHGFIYDADYLQYIRSLPDQPLSAEDLIKVIHLSCDIKRRVIEMDEKESGLRKILNFGHTFGHALEALSFSTEAPLLHGEAVSIGMVAEARISQSLGLVPEDTVHLLEHTLKIFELPTRYRADIDRERFYEKLKADKKNVNDEIRWSLLAGVGLAQHDCLAGQEAVEDAINYIQHEKNDS